ncbi:nucleoside 2-deoxyribosyltransferase domain-containing protein [Clostridium botulinum]|uniref:nucleoside 2-deoxyribosyltransferase domain-containing protein n=1 Tax=Clostridium botulinum TaxID=1491 RepID=UPI000773BFF4|nr:nucleoside 2-deoxyribosyltransferase domain-containing protein [Clostridium botulinum]
MKKVFLGGTCNDSKWRNKLIQLLKIEYFNPVVEDWTPECMEEEIKQRETCDFCLYVITPKMTGVYSIAEVIDDSNKRPQKTIFCFLEEDENPIQQLTSMPIEKLKFDKGQLRSLKQVSKMVVNNGGKYFKSLKEIADYLNHQ